MYFERASNHNGLSSLGGVTVEKGQKSCIDLLARSLGKSPKLTLRQAPQAASEAARRSPQLGTTASSAPEPGGNCVQCASIGSSVGLDPYSSSKKWSWVWYLGRFMCAR